MAAFPEFAVKDFEHAPNLERAIYKWFAPPADYVYVKTPSNGVKGCLLRAGPGRVRMSGCYTPEGRTTVPTEDAMAARGPGWHRVIHHVPETEQSGVRELMDRVDDSDRVITHAANVPGWGALMSYQNAAPVHPFFPAAQ